MTYPKPQAALAPNSYAFETTPLVKPAGFREYDARWWFGHGASPKAPEINLMGVQALGLGIVDERGRLGRRAVAHDHLAARLLGLHHRGVLKHAKVGGLSQVGDVVEFHAEPEVGTVGAVTGHRLVVLHVADRIGNLDV